MLEFDSLATALRSLAGRLPAQGQLRVHTVGEANELQGKAYYLDFPDRRVLVLITGLQSKQIWLARAICPHPQQSYDIHSRSGLSPRMTMDWAQELADLEAEWPKFQARPDRVRPLAGPALPPDLSQVISVALAGRLQAWSIDTIHLYTQVSGYLNCDEDILRLWWPQLQTGFRSAQPKYRLDLGLPQLPRPVMLHNPGFDILDLYAQEPKAHGILYLGPPHLSPDANQCLVPVTHSLGVPQSSTTFLRRQPAADQIVEFEEMLLLEKQGQSWRLTGSLPAYPSPPPALIQEKEKKRLQEELGDWGTVLSVEVKHERATEVQVLTPLGPRRVISAQAFALRETDPEAPPIIIKEPTLWINDHNLTGEAIRLAQIPESLRPKGQKSSNYPE